MLHRTRWDWWKAKRKYTTYSTWSILFSHCAYIWRLMWSTQVSFWAQSLARIVKMEHPRWDEILLIRLRSAARYTKRNSGSKRKSHRKNLIEQILELYTVVSKALIIFKRKNKSVEIRHLCSTPWLFRLQFLIRTSDRTLTTFSISKLHERRVSSSPCSIIVCKTNSKSKRNREM